LRKIIKGATVKCPVTSSSYGKSGKWGPLQVDLKISKKPGSPKFKILAVSWPIWPQHTARSVFINTKALPLLQQQVLQLQSAKIETISGATNVSDSFIQSLQAALVAAAKT
jgi:FMN-binding domain.